MARQFGGKGVFEVELAESYPFPTSQHGKLRALLEGMGIELSLDDFGTGYSSFAYLISLPISVIKIDKSFIDDLLSDQKRANAIALIRSIVALARELKLSVCAEGVESQDQVDLLIPLGIDEIQGYFVSKPLTAKKFEETFISGRPGAKTSARL
jgi:EAL domain-containing protein (putative c-di-GMP-specific phosphodiesterase class I)